MSTEMLDRVEPQKAAPSHRKGTILLSGGAVGLAPSTPLRRLTQRSTIEWDAGERETIRRAEEIWARAAAYGLLVYDHDTLLNLTPSEVGRGFDPATVPEHTVINAPMAGG